MNSQFNDYDQLMKNLTATSKELNELSKGKLKKKNGISDKILGYIIGVFILLPLVFYWWNHILLQHQIGYWHYLFLSFVVGTLNNVSKLFGHMYAIVFFGMLIIQTLEWINLLKFPLIH
jgi:hypothetical protein